MSISLMTSAFKATCPPTQKFVLLALCDSANDQGQCYPSIPTLCEKCSLSERAVQAAVQWLQACGYLTRDMRSGRSTVYWLTPDKGDPRTSRTPARRAPPQEVRPTPAADAPPPPHVVHPTPARRAPITVSEPSMNQKKAPTCVVASVLVEAGFDAETAAEFIAHKQRMKAPLTARAWADHLAESNKAGWSPLNAAIKVMAKSWKGFEAKYVATEPRQGGYQPPVTVPSDAADHTAAMLRRQAEHASGAAPPPIAVLDALRASRRAIA